MIMVGHHDEFINRDPRPVLLQFIPDRKNHPLRTIEFHHALRHIAEQEEPILNVNRHKVGATGGIVISLQPDGTAVMDVGVVGHGVCPGRV